MSKTKSGKYPKKNRNSLPDIGGKVRRLAVVALHHVYAIRILSDAAEIGFSSIDEITYWGPLLVGSWRFPFGMDKQHGHPLNKKNVTTGHQMPLGHPGVVGKFTQHK